MCPQQQGQGKEMIEDEILRPFQAGWESSSLLPKSIQFLTRPLWNFGERLKMPSFFR